MKIHIVRKPKKIKEPKNKKRKTKTIHVGTRKKGVFFLWGILIASITFGIYKNLTAIDQHTNHETKIIEAKVIDTHGIENFITNFIYDFYSWENTKEGLEKRTEKISYYLTPQLQQLNMEMLRSDIPTSSIVTKAQIWNVGSLDNKKFSVTYSVTQEIKESKTTSVISSNFKIEIYQELNGNLVIIKNPIAWTIPGHSSFESQEFKNNYLIEKEILNEIQTFLESFFKLYVTANKEEIKYYIKNATIPIINDNELSFLDLNILNIKKKDNIYKINLTTKYLDKKTKSFLFFEYNLELKKEDYWIIYYLG